MADKMYRTSPRENGKYYAIESSYDGGKTWHSTGDSSPTQEEANKKIENMKRLFKQIWDSYKEVMTLYGEAIAISKSL